MASALSDEEIHELQEAFEMFDKDGDGFITAQELGTVIRSVGRQISDRQLRKMIKECDDNRDGKIDFEEFTLLMKRHLKPHDYEEHLKRTFKVFDRDGNGFISRVELKQAMNKLDPTLTDDEIDQMLAEADTNNDGRINYEEFASIINSK